MSALFGTVLLGAQTVNVVNKVGTDVIIGVVTTTASSVGRLLTYITSIDHPGTDDIKKGLEDTDLDFFISVLTQLIKEQDANNTTESIKQALVGVNSVLEEIQKELTMIKESLENHYNKYFASWRSFDCNCSVDTVKKHREVLYKRYSLLTDLLNIYKN